MPEATIAALTAAPVEVQLGGKTFRMSPLRLREQGEYERWAQERMCALAGATGTTAETVEHIIGHVCRVGYFSPEAAGTMRTVDGMARLVWMGVRRNHPEVTLDTIIDTVTDDELLEALGAFNRVNGDGDAPEKKVGTPAPTTAT